MSTHRGSTKPDVKPDNDRAVGPLRGVWLVARREVTTRVRSRTFLLGMAALVVLIAGYVAFVALFGGASSRSTVGHTPQTKQVAEQLKAATRPLGVDVETREVSDSAAGERMVRDGELNLVVTGSPQHPDVVAKQNPNEAVVAGLNSVVRQQALDDHLSGVGLDPATVHRSVAENHVVVRSLQPVDQAYGQRLGLGLASIFLLYFGLQTFGTMVAQGVVEEKASRVVELLLSTIRPWQLLLGKVVGVALVSLVQLVVIGVLGVTVATFLGQLTIPLTAAGILVSGLCWYLIGFLLISTVLAATASLVSRQEDLGNVLAPTTVLLVVPFLVGFNLLRSDPGAPLVEVLSLIPPFGPILMPARTALGTAPAWQVGVSLALTVAALAVLVWLGGRIYSNAVLRFGGRVSLRDALRTK